MPKPVLGSQTLQDTFENLKQQGTDVVSGLKDLVSGWSQNNADVKGDSGIEQLSGQQDPKQSQQTQQSGPTPQQLLDKRAKEEREREFHLQRVREWDEHYRQMKEEDRAKAEREAAAEEEKKQQQIIQLREEQAKAETLQGQAKPKQGRGTAFLPVQAKAAQGTGELAKTPTN